MRKIKRIEEIEFSVLEDFVKMHRVLFARTNTKKMEFLLNGNIEIHTKDSNESWADSRLFWQGVQPFVALEEYNDLP